MGSQHVSVGVREQTRTSSSDNSTEKITAEKGKRGLLCYRKARKNFSWDKVALEPRPLSKELAYPGECLGKDPAA